MTDTELEEAEALLKAVYPLVLNDVIALVARPVRLVWDPTQSTASTDCVAEVRLAPWAFLDGHREEGFGTSYHESGHIRFSFRYGSELIARARKEDGETLAYIMNIVLDRKDDMLVAEYAPGFAERLRSRMLYLATLTLRTKYARVIERVNAQRKKRGEKKLTDKEEMRLLAHIPPQDTYEDFFRAAKWHRRPRFQATFCAMKYLTRSRLVNATPDELYYLAQCVREALGDLPRQQDAEAQKRFINLRTVAIQVAFGGNYGKKLDPRLAALMRSIAKLFVDQRRSTGLAHLLKYLEQASMGQAGSMSVGEVSKVPVVQVPPDPANRAVFNELLEPIAHLTDALTTKLRALDTPSEYTLYGQYDGDELDLNETARIALGLGGVYQETVIERDIDLAMHLAIDCSGSMNGEKVRVAKQIAALFSAGAMEISEVCDACVWSYNDKRVANYGPVSRESGFVAIDGEGGNSDTHMLLAVGNELVRSPRRRKVLFVLCDDGPDNARRAREISQQLLGHGVLVVHLLVGVHGAPDIYPFELLFSSMEELLEQLGDMLEVILSHMK